MSKKKECPKCDAVMDVEVYHCGLPGKQNFDGIRTYTSEEPGCHTIRGHRCPVCHIFIEGRE